MYFSYNFRNVLIKSGNDAMLKEIDRISPSLLEEKSRFYDFIDFSGNMITYINTKKYDHDNKKIEDMSHKSFNEHGDYHTLKTSTKPARLLRKILDRELTTAEVESLLGYLATDLYTIDVVEGEDIRKYYSYSTYADDCGSLNGSCMRYECCQDYFDLYVKELKMAVLRKIGEPKDIIYGRAILWDRLEFGSVKNMEEFVKEKDIKLIDRIYACTSKAGVFYEWAKLNGYHRKEIQTYGSTKIISPDGDAIKLGYDSNVLVHKMERLYDTYPYMDTIAHLCEGKKEISSASSLWIDRELDSTDGNDTSYFCECCGEGHPSEDDGGYNSYGHWICNYCLDEYYIWVDDMGEYVRVEDAYYCEECGCWYGNRDLITYCEDISEWVCNDCFEDSDTACNTEDGVSVMKPAYTVIMNDGETFYFHYDEAYAEFCYDNEKVIERTIDHRK